MDATTTTTKRFEFTGRFGEYFAIWIVNLALSLVTLGIYSAWAKVRNKRYFYGNTRLDGSSFEYLGDPLAILRGRLIAVGLFVVYSASRYVAPLAQPVLMVVFVVAVPWLVVKGLTFNARNSAFRNVRFGFHGRYGEAAMVMVGLPLLAVLTCGLAYPYASYRRHRFIVEHSAYGRTAFASDAGARTFYSIYLKALGLALLLITAGAVVSGTLVAKLIGLGVTQVAHGAEQVPPEMVLRSVGLAPFVMMGLMLPLYLFLGAYVKATVMNYVYNTAHLDQHGVRSTLSPLPLTWIYLTNLLAVVCSVGLLTPWARVRLARYRIERLALLPGGSLDTFVTAQEAEPSAVGEEVGEFFDVDFGL